MVEHQLMPPIMKKVKEMNTPEDIRHNASADNSASVGSDSLRYYAGRVDELSAQISWHRRIGRLFVTGEIATFVLFIAFVAAYAMLGWGSVAVWMAVISLVAYVATRHMDERNDARTAWLESLDKVCRRELSYLEGDYSAFDDGRRYADPQHPFVADIDVFGPNSLFQRICRTVTTGGSCRLAAMLSAEPVGQNGIVAGQNECFDDRLTPIERIGQRADAIEALRHAAEWRTEFCAVGVDNKLDTDSVVRAMQAVGSVRVPSFVTSPLAVVVAACMCLGLVSVIMLCVATNVPSGVAVVWAVAQLGIVLGACHTRLMKISRVVGKLQRQMAAYVKLLRMMQAEPLREATGDGMTELLVRLADATQGAVEAFCDMEHLVAGLDRRSNILGLVFSDIFTLSDFRLLRRFAKCQGVCRECAGKWIAAVDNMDALVSMATFSYNEPRGVRAQILSDDGVAFEAKGLWHPFLGKKAVTNDFSISDKNYYIVTGANMAGKSTFLRSLGINWLLAMNGMPVFATELRLSVFTLFTSMRTTDDLTRGISYFNAELLRLKSLIGFCAEHADTLIILDEILKGTNSADKLGGSRLFLEYMSRRRVTGVIATHDLELSRLADEQPSRFHNYCFEIELGRNVTYCYTISPGVARNQNATFLLRELLGE